LYIARLYGTSLPGGEDLLNALAKNAVALGDPAAAPSHQEIQLHCLAL
jgi:hypothetical protein